MKHRTSSLPVVVVIAVIALVLGSIGTAVAAPALTKGKVKAIAGKVVTKAAPTLSVAHATTATTATTATNALNAQGVTDGSITGADLSPGLKVFTSARKTCTAGAPLSLDATTFATCTIVAPEITQAVIDTDSVQMSFTLGSNEIALPYTSTAGAELNTLAFLLAPGTITLVRSSADATPPNISTGIPFKYTITPNSAGAAPTARPAPTGGASSVH